MGKGETKMKHVTLYKEQIQRNIFKLFQGTDKIFLLWDSKFATVYLVTQIKLLRLEKWLKWREAEMVGENWEGNSQSQRITAGACRIQQAALFHLHFHFSCWNEVSGWLACYLPDTPQRFMFCKALSHPMLPCDPHNSMWWVFFKQQF